MAGGKWLGLGLNTAMMVCAGLLGGIATAHADPICFSVNGVDSSGGCSVTPLAVGGTASLPVSFDTTLADGDTYQILGTPGSSNPNGVNFGAGTPFSIQYLGNSTGGASQADTLAATVLRAYTSNTTSLGVTALQSVRFSPATASGSTAQTTISLNGTQVAAFGPFSSSSGTSFSQVQSYSLGIPTGTLSQSNTYTTTFAAGSSVGSYVTYGTQPAPPLPTVVPTSCASIVAGVAIPTLGGLLGNNGNPASISGQPTSISTTFIPPSGLTLAQAAADCHVSGFDWSQQILQLPSPSPFYAASAPSVPLTTALSEPPINDPPPSGYTYSPRCSPGGAFTPGLAFQNAYPFYYNPNSASATNVSIFGNPYNDCFSLANEENLDTLNFSDIPTDGCLPGSGIAGILTYTSVCGLSEDDPGSSLIFQTELVGYDLLPGGTYQLVDLCAGLGSGCYDNTTFFWSDTFNGTSGGISTLDSSTPVDPGSGSGGITLLGTGQFMVPEPSSCAMLISLLMILFIILRNTKQDSRISEKKAH